MFPFGPRHVHMVEVQLRTDNQSRRLFEAPRVLAYFSLKFPDVLRITVGKLFFRFCFVLKTQTSKLGKKMGKLAKFFWCSGIDEE